LLLIIHQFYDIQFYSGDICGDDFYAQTCASQDT